MTPVEPSGAARAASDGISRRTIVKGAAWAVPVIAVAAPIPSVAASPCTPTTNFDNLQVGTRPTSVTFSPSGVTASLVWASNGQPSQTPGQTGRVAQTSTSPSWKYIEMEMVSSLRVGDWVQLTINVSQPVTGLSFILHDIDKERSAWVDLVEVETPGYTYQRGSNIVGTGTASDPFQPNAWGDTPIASGQGDVRLTWPGSIAQVKVKYRAGIDGSSSNQHIGLGNLRYAACVPAGQMRQARTLSVQSQPEEIRVTEGEIVFVESDGTQDL